MEIKNVPKLLRCLGRDSKKLIPRNRFVTVMRPTARCFSSAQQPKYDLSYASAGIVKSPFPDIVIPNMTVNQFVWENLDKWPNHVSVECCITGRKYTYAELRETSKKFAWSLRKLGFEPGTVLAIMLPNIPDYPAIVLGALEAGLVISPINPIYTAHELSHQLHDCGAVGLITMPKLLKNLEGAKKLVESKTNKPFSLTTITVNYDSAAASGTIDYKDMVADHIKAEELPPTRKMDDIAVLPYSSGTTGLSKGVELTHRNLVGNFLQVSHPAIAHIIPSSGDHQDVIPGILPFFHIYGLSVVLLRGLSNGCKIVSLPKFAVKPFLSILKDHKATVLYGVPPVVLLLGNNHNVKPDHFSYLRFIINGAGPVGQTDVEKVIARTNQNFTFSQAYGLTETSPAVFVSPSGRNDFTSLGVPVRNTYAKTVKPDGTPCEVGENGEICIKGPQIMKGYKNKPDATREVIDEEGYFHTGDIGYYNEEGRFYIVERIKELIKVQGFQVPPAELEMILRSHPALDDSGVIGIPDERTGEKPLAFVVTKPGAKVTENELKEFVADRVAPFKKLGGVVFTDTIPKSPAGKILRRILKQNYLNSN